VECVPQEQAQYHCPVELAVDLVGGRWTPVILAHLKQGELRYGQLCRLVPDISQKMLTQRLRELERARLVERTVHDEDAVVTVSYRLSAEGRELGPMLQAMYDWGERRAERDGVVISPVPR
jgi:DNA-binding HxlR family transcriptional regulator